MSDRNISTIQSSRNINVSNLSAIIENKNESMESKEMKRHAEKKLTLQRWHTGVSLVKQRTGNSLIPTPRARSRSLPGLESKLSLSDSFTKAERKTDTFRRHVRGLFKAKNAFKRCLDTANEMTAEQEPCPDIVEIKVLPSEPRFASTLSVEAQYAVMKGYEDNVYDWLSRRYPEKKRVLRRNITPVMVGTTKHELPEEPKRDLSDKINNIILVNKAVQKFKEVRKISSPQVDTKSTKKEVDIAIEHDNDIITQTSNHHPLGKIKGAVSRTQPDTSVETNEDDNVKDTRACSLPSIPTKAQLVMTNRYQIVMDIFDQLRQKEGVNPLSPRRSVKVNGRIPVREFNTWSQVWQKDFIDTYKMPNI